MACEEGGGVMNVTIQVFLVILVGGIFLTLMLALKIDELEKRIWKLERHIKTIYKNHPQLRDDEEQL
jgi:hypothetical protein